MTKEEKIEKGKAILILKNQGLEKIRALDILIYSLTKKELKEYWPRFHYDLKLLISSLADGYLYNIGLIDWDENPESPTCGQWTFKKEYNESFN